MDHNKLDAAIKLLLKLGTGTNITYLDRHDGTLRVVAVYCRSEIYGIEVRHMSSQRDTVLTLWASNLLVAEMLKGEDSE